MAVFKFTDMGRRKKEGSCHDNVIFDTDGHIDGWIAETDFGDRYVSLHRLHVNYILYCIRTGVKEEDICTDRVFSRALKSRGFDMKYMRDGAAFLIRPEGVGYICGCGTL